jgi:hypothetical protein
MMIFSFSKEITPIKEIIPHKAKINKDSLFISSLDTLNHKVMVRELYILHPTFRNKVIKMLYECKKQGIDLRIVETYRTPVRQNYLKHKRRSMLSGGYSKHQHFIAIDVVPVINGKYQWHNYKLWNKVGEIGMKQGLHWGGLWKKFPDRPHFELPIPVDSIKYIPLPDTVLIPLN